MTPTGPGREGRANTRNLDTTDTVNRFFTPERIGKASGDVCKTKDLIHGFGCWLADTGVGKKEALGQELDGDVWNVFPYAVTRWIHRRAVRVFGEEK